MSFQFQSFWCDAPVKSLNGRLPPTASTTCFTVLRVAPVLIHKCIQRACWEIKSKITVEYCMASAVRNWHRFAYGAD